MGCWGINAFESDAGLAAVGFLRKNLPENEKLELGEIISALQQDQWNVPSSVEDAPSHASPMALAGILGGFQGKSAQYDVIFVKRPVARTFKKRRITGSASPIQSFKHLPNCLIPISPIMAARIKVKMMIYFVCVQQVVKRFDLVQ